jgi:hypothetical protein
MRCRASSALLAVALLLPACRPEGPAAPAAPPEAPEDYGPLPPLPPLPVAALCDALRAGGPRRLAPDRTVEVMGVVASVGPDVDPRSGAPVWSVRLAPAPGLPALADCLFAGPEGVEHIHPMLHVVVSGRPDGATLGATGRVALRDAVLVHPVPLPRRPAAHTPGAPL